MQVKVKILDPKAVIPVKSHDDDFCYDLAAVSCTELAPGVYRYGFGIALQLKEEDDDSIVTGFTIRPRSSVWDDRHGAKQQHRNNRQRLHRRNICRLLSRHADNAALPSGRLRRTDTFRFYSK